MVKEVEYRSYNRKEAVIFWKTREKYGEFSNMAAGFPIRINEVLIPSSEALYQACKFPHMPDLQKKIISQTSPILSKRVCKPFEGKERKDWFMYRTRIMKWCLRVKAVQNWVQFTPVLLSSGDAPIVEYSEKDDFWGALPWGPDLLNGRNVLGRLLMDLRNELNACPKKSEWEIGLPNVENFYLLGSAIQEPEKSNGLNTDFSDIW